MKASPDDQLRLLDLQELDATLDRLAHRLRTAPEHEQIAALETTLARLDGDVVLVQTEDSDLGREQTKLEVDIDQVRQRATRDQQRLDAGQVGSPRELENLQSEIASLHRRQTDLEDQELEVMEKREVVQKRLGELQTERDDTTTVLAQAHDRLAATVADVERESADVSTRRGELAASLPTDLVGLYEKIRSASGGVGAAALHRGRCEGCHLQLNTTDLNALSAAAEDEVVRCEECRRILVRTAESGL